MKNVIVVASVGQALDRITFPRVLRIAFSGEHNAERDARIPLRDDAVERLVERVLDQCDEVAFKRLNMGSVSGSPIRQLNSNTFNSPLTLIMSPA